jgi:hypothetical protein
MDRERGGRFLVSSFYEKKKKTGFEFRAVVGLCTRRANGLSLVIDCWERERGGRERKDEKILLCLQASAS